MTCTEMKNLDHYHKKKALLRRCPLLSTFLVAVLKVKLTPVSCNSVVGQRRCDSQNKISRLLSEVEAADLKKRMSHLHILRFMSNLLTTVNGPSLPSVMPLRSGCNGSPNSS